MTIELKQFTLTLITKEPRMIDRIESDDLIQLLSQLNFVIANVVKKTIEFKQIEDDDVPF